MPSTSFASRPARPCPNEAFALPVLDLIALSDQLPGGRSTPALGDGVDRAMAAVAPLASPFSKSPACPIVSPFREPDHVAVITGPAFDPLRAAGIAKMAHDIAVGIEDTDVGNRVIGHLRLTACLAQQILRAKHRRRAVMLGPQDRRPGALYVIGHELSDWRRNTLNWNDCTEPQGVWCRWCSELTSVSSRPNARASPAGS
jgi:hypothetical protein